MDDIAAERAVPASTQRDRNGDERPTMSASCARLTRIAATWTRRNAGMARALPHPWSTRAAIRGRATVERLRSIDGPAVAWNLRRDRRTSLFRSGPGGTMRRLHRAPNGSNMPCSPKRLPRRNKPWAQTATRILAADRGVGAAFPQPWQLRSEGPGRHYWRSTRPRQRRGRHPAAYGRVHFVSRRGGQLRGPRR
jgi:hypothetical protein